VEINKLKTENVKEEEDLTETLVKVDTLMDKSKDVFTDAEEKSFTHTDNDDSIPQRNECIH